MFDFVVTRHQEKVSMHFQVKNKYPFAAAIVDSASKNVKCAATIIAAKYLVTNAKPCVVDLNVVNAFALVGSEDYNNSKFPIRRRSSNKRKSKKNLNLLHSCPIDDQYSQLIKIEKTYIHPQYVEANTVADYNIGILQLKSDFQFDVAVGPICLPFK